MLYKKLHWKYKLGYSNITVSHDHIITVSNCHSVTESHCHSVTESGRIENSFVLLAEADYAGGSIVFYNKLQPHHTLSNKYSIESL